MLKKLPQNLRWLLRRFFPVRLHGSLAGYFLIIQSLHRYLQRFFPKGHEYRQCCGKRLADGSWLLACSSLRLPRLVWFPHSTSELGCQCYMISGLILSHCLKKNSLGDTYSVLYRCRQYGVDVRDVSKKVEAGVACDFPAETGMNCSSYTHPTVCYDSVLNISQPSVKLSSCPVYLSNPSARDRLFQSPLNPHSCA